MKKLAALLMLVVLAVSMTSAALAYTPVTPTTGRPPVTHTLTLTDSEMNGLSYEIIYSFDVEPEATVMQPSDITNILQPSDITNKELAVTGAPVIAALTYKWEDNFDNATKSCTKNLEIDWSEVEIKEPGVYRWMVTKSYSDTDPTSDPTNSSEITYLYAYAIDNNGTLTVESVGMTSAAELNDSSAKGNLGDTYPAQKVDLSISKTVTGNQGSKDQYFKFIVQLTSPAGAASATYNITGHDLSVPATAYHEAKTNVQTVTVNAGATPSSVELWIKHDQTVKIENMIFGTSYTITESANAGYTVTTAVTGDVTGTNSNKATVSDTSLGANTTVAFTNNKEAVVPTGVDLHTGMPFFGILLAMGMMIVTLIGKRKENA